MLNIIYANFFGLDIKAYDHLSKHVIGFIEDEDVLLEIEID